MWLYRDPTTLTVGIGLNPVGNGVVSIHHAALTCLPASCLAIWSFKCSAIALANRTGTAFPSCRYRWFRDPAKQKPGGNVWIAQHSSTDKHRKQSGWQCAGPRLVQPTSQVRVRAGPSQAERGNQSVLIFVFSKSQSG
jgi:hypothetical protein